MTIIYIDADACPMKDEVYAAGKRLGLLIFVVANRWMNMPNDPQIRLEVVNDGFDAADHWIAARAQAGDVVISDDIPLAARCLGNGAAVITNRGEIRDQDSIAEALAMRSLMQYLRAAGDAGGGQKAIDQQSRRRFRQQLDKILQLAQQRP